MDLTALKLSLQLSAVTTVILLLIGTPLAWWLANTRLRGRFLVEAVVVLPIVLPPTVLGFYLLELLGADGPLASALTLLDAQLVFSFTGLVIGSVIFSLPFVVYPLKNVFERVPRPQLEAAATLGAGAFDRFISVAVPSSRSGFLAAAVLVFAHTVGEFGVVLMLGGNIPGETQVLSIAIYNHVEQLEYSAAHALSAGLVAFSFVVLAVLHFTHDRQQARG